MKKDTMRTLTLALAMLLLFAPLCALADMSQGESVWTLTDASGKVITKIAGDVEVGDEYIAGDNTLYRVVKVDKATYTAVLEPAGEEPMTHPVLAQTGFSLLAQQNGDRRIGVYVTHSDESYESGDGTSSIDSGWAGIHDVATELCAQLGENNVETVFDPAVHLPHDAGAYRRSRATAVELAKQGVSALVDIHRDGIPDAGEYATTVEGEETTMVRLLVGRSNPNSAANREFAKKLKAAADSQYPGLVKDIYIGKGNYNQELMPQSVLLEFGTHTSDKEKVLSSTKYMAQVLTTVLFGGSGQSGESGQSAQNGENAKESADPSAFGGGAGRGGTGQPDVSYQGSAAETGAGSGVWKAVLWIVGIAVVGVVLFAVLSNGGFGGLGQRLKGFFGEVTATKRK